MRARVRVRVRARAWARGRVRPVHAFLKGPPLGDSASKLETTSAVEYSARSRRSNSEALLFAASGAHCLACGATVRGGGYARGRYRRTPEQAALRLRCVRLRYVEGRHSMATLRAALYGYVTCQHAASQADRGKCGRRELQGARAAPAQRPGVRSQKPARSADAATPSSITARGNAPPGNPTSKVP